jgi:acyloxyacyl hydrolase
MKFNLPLLLLLAWRAAAQSENCAVCTVLFTLAAQLSHNYTSDPSTLCVDLGACNGSCLLADGAWPIVPVAFPTDGAVDDTRRRLHGAAPDVVDHAGGEAMAEGLRSAARAYALAPPPVRGGDTLAHVVQAAARAAATQALAERLPAHLAARSPSLGPCDGGLNLTCDIERVFDHQLPLADTDDDTSPDAVAWGPFFGRHFRGVDWRGQDCNDTNAAVYPGRRARTTGANVDHNCNGIAGVDSATGVDYEVQFCSGLDAPLSLVILGDSATAHFHLPPQYVNAPALNLSNLVDLLANEADWPACSWATAFRNASVCPAIPANTTRILPANVSLASIYQRMVGRNACNHRGYTNIGVNGARVTSYAPPDGTVTALKTQQDLDSPALVFYALIGNDVCNGHPGSGDWTSVADFKASVLSALSYLDAVLPIGSHVAFIPLADGRVLYNATHQYIHPLGVGYPDVYDFLSCSNCNPCWGWLNTNATWRDATTAQAKLLSSVYADIVAQNASSFSHFDMHLVAVDWVAMVDAWTGMGGSHFEVVEPVDGFHPSQLGHYLLAETVWDDLSSNKPGWLPRVNPHNADIARIFGNQGGY